MGEPDTARASAPADTDSRVWTAPRRAPQGGRPEPRGLAAPPQELRRESSWVSSLRAFFLIRALVNFGDGRVTCDRNREPHGFPDLSAGCRRAPTRLWAFRGGRRHQATESGRVATRACGAVAASGGAGGRAASPGRARRGAPGPRQPLGFAGFAPARARSVTCRAVLRTCAERPRQGEAGGRAGQEGGGDSCRPPPPPHGPRGPHLPEVSGDSTCHCPHRPLQGHAGTVRVTPRARRGSVSSGREIPPLCPSPASVPFGTGGRSHREPCLWRWGSLPHARSPRRCDRTVQEPLRPSSVPRSCDSPA